MFSKTLYWICTVVLFLGLLWVFLPHAFHNAITQENETSHYTHIIEGIIPTIIALVVMIWNEEKSPNHKHK